MRSYYNKEFNQLESHGLNLARKIHLFLSEIYKQEGDNGYSIRELTGLINHEAVMCECDEVINIRFKLRKKDV